MSDKLEAPLDDATLLEKPYWLNAYIAGYQGYLELQKLTGSSQDQDVLATYQHLLDLRVSGFAKDTPYPALGSGSEDWELSYHNAFAVARNFMSITPELADYLNQHISDQVQEAVAEYESVAPYWFVSKFDVTYGEGTFQHLYDYPALFQAKAYALKEPYGELVKWLEFRRSTREICSTSRILLRRFPPRTSDRRPALTWLLTRLYSRWSPAARRHTSSKSRIVRVSRSQSLCRSVPVQLPR